MPLGRHACPQRKQQPLLLAFFPKLPGCATGWLRTNSRSCCGRWLCLASDLNGSESTAWGNSPKAKPCLQQLAQHLLVVLCSTPYLPLQLENVSFTSQSSAVTQSSCFSSPAVLGAFYSAVPGRTEEVEGTCHSSWPAVVKSSRNSVLDGIFSTNSTRWFSRIKTQTVASEFQLQYLSV